MPGPFPGMDPWLERPGLFPDFHNRFIGAFSAALNAALPRPYYSAIANRVYVEDSDRMVEPDVNLFRPAGRRQSPRAGGPVAAVGVKPVIVHSPSEDTTEWYLDVFESPDGDRLVATIEVLSRANKEPGTRGRRLYRKKQREMLRGRVNTVEFDLLRSGVHTTAVQVGRAVRKAGPFDYHVCIHRARKPDDYEVYPILLPQRLPAVAVPLLKGVPDVAVELQPIFDHCYDAGLYAQRAKYDRPTDPPLTPEQQAWAEGMLREKGLLPTPGSAT